MATGISRVCCDCGGGAASLIHQASVTLSDSDIISLGSIVTIPLVPTPGANKGLAFSQGFIWADISHGAYGGIADGATLGIFTGPGAGVISGALLDSAADSESMLSDLLTSGGVVYAIAPVADVFPTAVWHASIGNELDTSRVVNGGWKVMMVGNGGDLSGGGAGNELNVLVEFRVLDFTLKRFVTTVESGWNETTRVFA